jgi:hypothetical protein
MSKARLATVVLALGSLALAGCLQGVGERCEQNSDCSSGVCGNGSAGMTSANARTCSASLPPPAPISDAATTTSDASDAGDAGDAADAALEGAGASDASEAGAEAGAETSPSEAGAESGLSEVGAETSPMDASGTESGG